MDLESLKAVGDVATPAAAVVALLLTFYQEFRRQRERRPKVKITLGWGFITHSGASFVPVKKRKRPNISVVRGATGEPSPTTLTVSVENRGGSAVDVSGVEVAFANGSIMTHGLLGGQKPLPHRLEPHSEMSWAFEESVIKTAVRTFQTEQEVQIAVRLPGGKRKKTRQSLIYPANGSDPA